MDESKLIFIISQPRSGSTYLQNLLSNNNQVNTCSEPWILLNFSSLIKPELIQATYNHKLANEAFKDFIGKYPSIKFTTGLKEMILDMYQPMAEGFDYVIDKTPRYWEMMDEIVEWFPKSKIIILKRHPVDVATSIIKTWNIKKLTMLSRFQRDLLLAPEHLHLFSNKHQSNPQVFTLKYEDLQNNKVVEIRNLYSWLGLDYHEAVLNAETNKKHKGMFGDPFQNKLEKSEETVQLIKSAKLSKDFEEFIIGYKHYLTPEFMESYGNYKLDKGRETKIFGKFLLFSNDVNALNNKFLQIKYSTSYKVGKMILYPIVTFKRFLSGKL
ncbi:sulfotransferase [Subsaximicrobium wynnwilliamsii]|uniref:Sulfotransferase n=1 Tax=Subsaximicrobium wynnwilliamsii TaxID=291179 RepID=A0A5C6ZD60_9FLAO|nr:sulfotransferase [Subsaximicrobium wynnwilliamsii]TXD81699.1 sulfotransferase [Subsaximicrobium wynnwilliamsii]TXD87454.1 sulfotransferase [Subsaximicrobium wynnwilliamsii]TXE01142.1 sulfotransferase [Subsaximicrobium wynnwilliamsii]